MTFNLYLLPEARRGAGDLGFLLSPGPELVGLFNIFSRYDFIQKTCSETLEASQNEIINNHSGLNLL